MLEFPSLGSCLRKSFKFLKELVRFLLMADTAKLLLDIVRVFKRDTARIDPKHLAVKPSILSDANILTGLRALRVVTHFVPAAPLLSPLLGLGEVGLNLWKTIALSGEYTTLTIPPLGVNILETSVSMDPVLKKNFQHLLDAKDWEGLAKVYDDFWFITDRVILETKYPTLPIEYIQLTIDRNKALLKSNLNKIEYHIRQNRHIPEVDQNIREALYALQEIFPAMRDWALFQSESYDELLTLVDSII